MENYIRSIIVAVLIAISTFLGGSSIRSVKNETRLTKVEESIIRQEQKLDMIIEHLIKEGD